MKITRGKRNSIKSKQWGRENCATSFRRMAGERVVEAIRKIFSKF